MYCDGQEDKYRALIELYHVLTVGSSVVFVKEHETAFKVQRRLEADGHKVAALHGANEGPDRDRAIDAFRSGKAKVLITSNPSARGIYVATVTMVVHFDLPVNKTGRPDPVTYLERIGRTRRSGRLGLSICFAHDKQSTHDVNEISNYLGIGMTRVPTHDLDEVEKVLEKVLKST
ncbi:P-loop containing nucleoside triphosphate hydrolase protein [Tuber brumale]|nr:P-loop containing nucleoside triphosphate hydrolase protein [Tuber brumale]KAG0639066.1 P-loop containing nucleoside triphosphate hydrolase protein [Tuber brumale]